MRSLLVTAFLVVLGGCAPTIGSVAGGECKLTHTPTYAVAGKTSYDQEWIDDTTEALVRGCKQPRPKTRPASLSVPVKSPAAVTKPKKHWWQR